MNLQNTTLKKVIGRAKEGDSDAFQVIFEDMSDRLFSYALSHSNNRDDALDSVQETFIDLWNSLPAFRYKSDEAFYGFAFIILKRKLYKNYRTSGRTISLDEMDIDIREENSVGEDYRHLHKNLSVLSSKYQELLKLRYWLGMTFNEISQVLNIKETTAKVRHYRAIQKLKNNIKKYDY